MNGVLEKQEPASRKSYWLGTLTAGGKSTDRVLAFDRSGPLQDLIRIEVSALGLLSSPLVLSFSS